MKTKHELLGTSINKMIKAYDNLKTIFSALAKVDSEFLRIRKELSKLSETKVTYSFSNFCDFKYAGTEEKANSWEIEIAAKRKGTEARWIFEIELNHEHCTCELNAAAGFQGKYGPMKLREVETIFIEDLNTLCEDIDKIMGLLFSDLDGDCEAAIKADLEEMERIAQKK